MLKTLVFIAVGGAFGAVSRYATSLGIYSLLGRNFPYGTLFVNVAGSFLMGVLSIMLLERFNLGPEWRAAILVGFLGSFTTFSTFSIETLNLFELGDINRAVLNMSLSLILCLLAVWFGINVGRQL
jgi:fluoride exporter